MSGPIGRKIRLVIVDDHQLVRTGIQSILEESGEVQVVGQAGDGQAGVDLVLEINPDVVMMDLNMPGIGGSEAIRRLLQVRPHSRVIVLSALEDDPFPHQLMEVGAKAYLTKGGPAEEMLAAIRTVASGGIYIATEIARKQFIQRHQSSTAHNPFADLSSREMEVTMMIVNGYKNQDIADKLEISPKTVSTLKQRIFSKTGVDSEVNLTRLAYRHGLIDDHA